MAHINGTSNGKPDVLSPSKLGHVFLMTNNYETMKKSYKAFLSAHAAYEDELVALLTYDDEHHRIAIANVPHLQDKDGVHPVNEMGHLAFTFDSLKDLCTAYRQRRTFGIEPGLCVHHGMSTSMYYQDPDGNQIETEVDNFHTADEANEYMVTPGYRANPLGTEFDPVKLCRAVESGEDETKLKMRKDVAPAGSIGEVMAKTCTAKVGKWD